MSAKKTTVKPSEGSFEGSLKRLGEIVEQLEGGSVTLDEVMKLYEEGIVLSKKCMDQLSEAELKVRKLMKSAGGAIELADGVDE